MVHGIVGEVIPLFCEAIRQEQPLIIYGGQQIIDLVWVGDVVQAFWDASQCEGWQGPINVGSGIGITVLNLAKLICTNAGFPDWPMVIHSPRSIEVSQYVSDTTKMATTLGWAPDRVALEHLSTVMASYGIVPARR